MSRLLILGATGSLGPHVLRLALVAGHDVTVLVRTPSKLPPEVSGRVSDAAALMLANLDRGNPMSRRRVGLALPLGMRGSKAL